ncbi:hypothetical protein BTGOE6_43110 [Bacillus wiedmannii]|nr:hypothetical protein BTGOE6_43110 [Bacillus wiedmannii]
MAKFSSKDRIQAVKRYLEGTEGVFLLTNYMTVVDIDPLNKSIICTDAFYNNMTLILLMQNKTRATPQLRTALVLFFEPYTLT